MEETNVLPRDHPKDVSRFVQQRIKILLLTLQRRLPHIKRKKRGLTRFKYHLFRHEEKCCQIWAFYVFAACSRRGP